MVQFLEKFALDHKEFFPHLRTMVQLKKIKELSLKQQLQAAHTFMSMEFVVPKEFLRERKLSVFLSHYSNVYPFIYIFFLHGSENPG